MILLYNRRTKTFEEELIFEEGLMRFIYGTRWGRALEHLLLKRPLFSLAYGLWQRSRWSAKNIPSFIERYRLDLEQICEPPGSWRSFNDFFCRRLHPSARPIDMTPEHLIAPADSRMMVYSCSADTVLPVKGRRFTLAQLMAGRHDTAAYHGGLCLIFRLAPSDYHRFCYIDGGRVGPMHPINGCFHSVSPLSLSVGRMPFTDNYREFCVFDTDVFGPVIHLDVGALVVGRIKQNRPHGGRVERGEEKGWFEFGGSTIIQLIAAGRVCIYDDIQAASLRGIETLVSYGQAIGRAGGRQWCFSRFGH